jgi:hypothetical protein
VTTDRVSDSGKQGPSNQRSIDFLDAFSGFDRNMLWLAGSVPGGKDLRNTGYYSDERLLAMPDDERHHVTGATYPPGLVRRDDSRLASVPFIVFDDVGRMSAPGVPQINSVEVDEDLFKLLPETSWQTETSHGNHQYGYHFEPALTPPQARLIHAALRRHRGDLARGLHSLGQYFRLPSGTNTKPGRKSFRTRLKQLGPSYTAEQFIAGFQLELDYIPSGGLGATTGGEKLPPDAVKKLLEMIPNTDTTDYDFWVRVGHAIYGATDGSSEGLDLFLEWSAKSAKFNLTQDTEKTWDSLSAARASASTLRRIIEDIHGADSRERQEAAQVFAATGGVFGKIGDDEEEIPGGTTETPGGGGSGGSGSGAGDEKARKAGMKLDELLREIRKTQVVPPHHRNGDGPHWSRGGKVQTLREALKSGTVAPPQVVTPYERGILSVLAGMPGLGKSLLALQQALAITYGRADLIRYGGGKLQFPGDVIYISNEDGLGLIKRRAAAWLRQHGLEAVDPAFEIIPMKSALLSWNGTEWQFECLAILEMVLEYVRGGRDIAMIVVDTLATSVTGINENAAQDVSPVMAFLDQLAKVFWASVVFVHHVNKVSVGEEDRSIVAIKGSFAISGAVRGAVTLTPANRGEIDEFGWNGRSVIAEYVAKANDDRARYVACYYEQTVLGIGVGDAIDPTVTVTQDTPILMPLKPVKAVDDMIQMRAWRDLIEAAIKAGKQVRRYAANANNTGPKSVHRILGVTVKQAFEIVEKLSDLGQVKVEMVYDPEAKEKVPTVIMSHV